MIYLSGIHALNLPCRLNTCGDWHCSALKWKDLTLLNSDNSIYKEYGIEPDRTIPEHNGSYYVANHIRAILDLLEMGAFPLAQGMRDDFICTSEYDDEIFGKVLLLNKLPHWKQIDAFMRKEYYMKWVNYLRDKENKND